MNFNYKRPAKELKFHKGTQNLWVTQKHLLIVYTNTVSKSHPKIRTNPQKIKESQISRYHGGQNHNKQKKARPTKKQNAVRSLDVEPKNEWSRKIESRMSPRGSNIFNDNAKDRSEPDKFKSNKFSNDECGCNNKITN